LSRQRNDSAGLVLGHQSSGRTLFFVGRFASSRLHLEEALALYDPVSHHSLMHQAGDDPHVSSLGFLAMVSFCLGYPDQALAGSDAAIAEALGLAHPPSLGASLSLACRLLSLVRDDAALDERAGQLAAVATEQGFVHLGAQGTMYLGWAKIRNGDIAQGYCCCAVVPPLTVPPGRSCGCPIISAFWPRHTGPQGKVKRLWPIWT